LLPTTGAPPAPVWWHMAQVPLKTFSPCAASLPPAAAVVVAAPEDAAAGAAEDVSTGAGAGAGAGLGAAAGAGAGAGASSFLLQAAIRETRSRGNKIFFNILRPLDETAGSPRFGFGSTMRRKRATRKKAVGLR
jgi:hypothetical protein